ncbi:MAG: hypothetical protein JW798_01870 [Prolixibacteraceae bacterium]|nr:hypothetical protein [Prolixibacteraceae bacterium]
MGKRFLQEILVDQKEAFQHKTGLIRRCYELYYFSKKYECDFPKKENVHITEAMQVSFELNADNAGREIGGLSEVMKSFNIPKGTLLVFNENKYPVELPKGVSIIPAYNFLMPN